MRGFGYIKALISGPSAFPDVVQGTDVSDGVTSRRALLTYEAGSVHSIMPIAEMLIKGTAPHPNWDRIIKTASSENAVVLQYSYLDEIQFYIEAYPLHGNFDVSFTATEKLTLEAGMDRLLSEDGTSFLLQE